MNADANAAKTFAVAQFIVATWYLWQFLVFVTAKAQTATEDVVKIKSSKIVAPT